MLLLQGLSLISITIVISWLQGNLKNLIGLDWEPWKYWAVFSFVKTWCGLTGWWKIMDHYNNNAWECILATSILGLCINVVLMSCFYGVNYKYALCLCLVVLGSVISRF